MRSIPLPGPALTVGPVTGPAYAPVVDAVIGALAMWSSYKGDVRELCYRLLQQLELGENVHAACTVVAPVPAAPGTPAVIVATDRRLLGMAGLWQRLWTLDTAWEHVQGVRVTVRRNHIDYDLLVDNALIRLTGPPQHGAALLTSVIAHALAHRDLLS